MIGLYVSVPIACFRPGAAREFWESLPLPPPSTIYGFLLSFVGETDRTRHLGVRCTCGTIGEPFRSSVLRRMWRIKELGGASNATQGNGSNVRPDYQQLLSNVRLVIWIDSSEEEVLKESLETRIKTALSPSTRGSIERFGGLSLGESTHLVDEVSLIERMDVDANNEKVQLFVVRDRGRFTLSVWVDHVGSAGTRYANGDLVVRDAIVPPNVEELPKICSTSRLEHSL